MSIYRQLDWKEARDIECAELSILSTRLNSCPTSGLVQWWRLEEGGYFLGGLLLLQDFWGFCCCGSGCFGKTGSGLCSGRVGLCGAVQPGGPWPWIHPWVGAVLFNKYILWKISIGVIFSEYLLIICLLFAFYLYNFWNPSKNIIGQILLKKIGRFLFLIFWYL